MRLLTTLLTGAAALICAGTAFSAENIRSAAVEPAVRAAPAPAKSAVAAKPAGAVEAKIPEAKAIDAKAPDTLDAKDPDSLDAKPADEGSNADSDSIAATVNDESISDYEVRQRMALFIATSGLTPTEADKKRIRGQILDQLQNEKIELQEAVKKKITVSPVEVDKQINRLLSENHFSMDQLRGVLVAAGSSEDALRSQITAQLAWQKTVQSEYQDDVNITPAQIDTEMQRFAEGANKPHYLVSEIFLPVDSADQDAKVKKNIDEVVAQIRAGAPFPAVAHQFSQNPSAAAGGDIGWVHDGQLAAELNATLTKMTPGLISDPVRSVGGYYILALRERQEPLGTKVDVAEPVTPAGPAGTLPLARLLLPMTGANKAQVEAAMKAAMQVKAAVTSCDQLAKIHESMQGTVYMNLGEMKVGELSPEIQKALAETKSGEIATPFMSEAGIEIIARCDKRAAPPRSVFTMPTREQVEEQLFEEQIAALARRYIRDLKREANIQVRDEHGDVRDAALLR